MMINITSIWPYFICMAWLVGVAHVLARNDPQPSSQLHVPLESLRGWCATGVFFCHAVITYYFFKSGQWTDPPSQFYSFFGVAGVTVFFFLSGYLFWSKCIADDGVRNVRSFWTKRARRLVPAYFASFVMIACIVFVRTGFSLRVRPMQFGIEVLRWLTFGFGYPTLNGLPDAILINAGVVWTLQFEIVFYLLLPLLYRLFNGYRLFIWIGLLSLCYWRLVSSGKVSQDPLSDGTTLLANVLKFVAFGFGFGMAIALLKTKCPAFLIRILQKRKWSFIPIIFLILPILLRVNLYSDLIFLLLGISFIFVVAGTDFWGFFSNRAMLLLGKASYSFYLTHGIVLFVVMHGLNHWKPIATLDPISYWLWVALAGTLTLVLSVLMYRYVEIPFMTRTSVFVQEKGVAQGRFPHPLPDRKNSSGAA